MPNSPKPSKMTMGEKDVELGAFKELIQAKVKISDARYKHLAEEEAKAQIAIQKGEKAELTEEERLTKGGITRLEMKDIEELMTLYRALEEEDRVKAFCTIVENLPNEHMVAQLALLGQPDGVREPMAKKYEEHLTKLKETDPKGTTEAAVVARTLLHLHSRVKKKQQSADDEDREKLPPLWKRALVIPACIGLVLVGFVLKQFIEDYRILSFVMMMLAFVGGYFLMEFLGFDDTDDDNMIEDFLSKKEEERSLVEDAMCGKLEGDKKVLPDAKEDEDAPASSSASPTAAGKKGKNSPKKAEAKEANEPKKDK